MCHLLVRLAGPKWIGNTEPLAAKHHLQPTDAHSEHAVHAVVEAAQNPVGSDGSDREDKPENEVFPRRSDELPGLYYLK
jgi:hypothetical protein